MVPYESKSTPTVWITWLSKLMADELQCHWSAWFRSHYTYEKLPSNFDSSRWKARHRSLLDERVAWLESEGYRVYLEGENWFGVPGRQYSITVSGKPDIVAICGDQAWVEDRKTGRPKSSDLFQVLLYMVLVPAGVKHCQGLKLEGRLVYPDSVIDVEASQVDEEFKAQLRAAIATLSNINSPRKVPSIRECRYCDIPAKCCPERIEDQPSNSSANHELF
jgi:CRISPR/Cas system-associated exonuclease Cas4 (RecB family)